MTRVVSSKQGYLIDWIATPHGQGWEHLEPDAVVWVDVRRLDAAFSMRAGTYVGMGGSGAGQAGRYSTVGKFIKGGHPVWMPFVSPEGDGSVIFADGRHRFAWVRDHGAKAIPVTTGPESAGRLAARVGTRRRRCTVFY